MNVVIIEPLSVNPSGEWSPVQARKVLEIIQPEAAIRGLYFQPVDITTMSMPHRRLILVAHCLIHEVSVALDDVCPLCWEEIPVTTEITTEPPPVYKFDELAFGSGPLTLPPSTYRGPRGLD